MKNEIKGITILEVYQKVLYNNTDLEYDEVQEAIKQLKDLEHFAHITSGLWCTDRPGLLKDKTFFWEIDFFSNIKCRTCEDTGWVCESHEDLPFGGMSDNGCKCGGAGMPCKFCNELK